MGPRMSLVFRFIALMAVLSLAGAALAGPPGATDVEVKWDAGYPKVVAGKLQMKGTVTFQGKWESVNNKVTITIAPTKGGTATIRLTSPVSPWSDEVGTMIFPGPQDYDIVPSVQVWEGMMTVVYVVTGARKTITLP